MQCEIVCLRLHRRDFAVLLVSYLLVLCIIETDGTESDGGSRCCPAGETLQYTSTKQRDHSTVGGRGEVPELLEHV